MHVLTERRSGALAFLALAALLFSLALAGVARAPRLASA